jgi:hypothetical protein
MKLTGMVVLALSLVLVIAAAAGCDTAPSTWNPTGAGGDADADTDTDADTDADSDSDADTDTDTDTGTDTGTDTDTGTSTDTGGNACVVSVEFGGYVTFDLDGVCQPSTADCVGGTTEGLGADPIGDCTGDGIVCCINTDVCENLSPSMGSLACSATSTSTYCMQVGCPDYGFCCASMGG